MFATAGTPLWLGGDSASGNLATVVTRQLHAVGGAAIAGNILAYPCTQGLDASSLDDFAPPFMSAADIRWFFDMYLPQHAAATNPDLAPMLAYDLSRLPPTLVITAEHDLITAQAEAYAERLSDSGVEVIISRVAGMIHGFLTLDAFLQGAAAKEIDGIAAFIAQRRS